MKRTSPLDHETSWRGVWLLLLLFFGSMVVAAVVSPLVYQGVQAWAAGSESRLAGYLAEKDFPRYFDRLRWLCVVAGLPWVLSRAGFWGRRGLGLEVTQETRASAGRWLALGLVMIGAISAAQLAAGTVTPRGLDAGKVVEVIALGLLSATVVGFVEEVVFRGLVLGVFRQALADVAAIPLAAAFFALVHFQRVPSDVWEDGAPVGLGTGFEVALGNLTSVGANLEPLAALALFAAGLALCLIRVASGSLLPCVALHAGWVWPALTQRRLLLDVADGPTLVWGSRQLIDGVVPVAAIAALAIGLAVRPALAKRGRAAPGTSS